MCTVTYLPLEKEGFILTSTRDEKSIRQAALHPKQYKAEDIKVIYPKDPDASGTWVASSLNYSLCLLNGGLIRHVSNPPYRMSRGHIILDFFKFGNPESFRKKYDFKGIEPFTLLIIGYKGRSLDEIRWDGKQIHHKEFNPELPGIWSSVTLYSDEIISLRQNWFHEWLLTNPGFNIINALDFHKKGGMGDPDNDIFMKRDNVRTVSITSISKSRSLWEIYYEDMLSGKISHLNNLPIMFG